jgi:hypothetical protein
MFNKVMSRLIAYALGASVFALFSVEAVAVVPPVNGNGVGASATCLLGDANVPVRHFDKIIFLIGEGLTAQNNEDQEAINALPTGTELDIKVRDNPGTVADLKAKVLTFLGAAVTADNRNLITITDVEYAVICATGVQPGPGPGPEPQ